MNTNDVKQAIDNVTVKMLVTAYLITRAKAEVIRERVDEIQNEIISDIMPISTWKGDNGRVITTGKDLYLCDDEALCTEIYAKFHEAEVADGIKPADMNKEYCPALVAECEQNNLERELINAAGEPLGITNHKLLCHHPGVETRQKFIDLVVKAVFSLPDYKPPTL